MKKLILLLAVLSMPWFYAHAGRDGGGDRRADIGGISRVAFIPTPHGFPNRIIAQNHQVLISNGESSRGLQAIDWRDAEQPRLGQYFDVGNRTGDLVRLEHRVYHLTSYHGISIFNQETDGKLTRLNRWRMAPPVSHGRKMAGMVHDGRHYLYLHIAPEGDWKDWPPGPVSPEPGLYVLDVTEAKKVAVEFLGSIPVFDSIRDGFGYVIRGTNLDVYALQDPLKPSLVGTYQASGGIRYISVDGDFAWLTVNGRTLELLDLHRHSFPVLLGRSEGNGLRNAGSVASQGEWAYVVDSVKGVSSLHVFRWNSGVLQHVSVSSWLLSDLQTIALDGDSAYITDSNYGVWRFDLSQPDSPRRGELFMSAGENQQLLIDGKLGLLNLEWGGSVGILDVSDPLHIKISAYYRPGSWDDYAVGISDGYFYYGRSTNRRIIDVRDPAHPVEAGQWKLPGKPLIPPLKWKGYFFEWLGMGAAGVKLVAYDMQNPLRPIDAGAILLSGSLAAQYGAAVSDGKRMFAVANDSIIALDVSVPSAMQVIGQLTGKGIGYGARYSWQAGGRRAVLNGDFLYVIQGTEAEDAPHIAIFDVSRPSDMRMVYTTPETPPTYQDDWFDSRLLHQGDMLNDMVLHGEFLYVSDYWGGVRVYDCRNPSRPELKRWEFQPYLSLVPDDWSRQRYEEAVASGDLHKSLGLSSRAWKQRHKIGRKLWDESLEHHPGYELFAWNIGGVVGDYLLQPKLGGIAVYHAPASHKSREREEKRKHTD